MVTGCVGVERDHAVSRRSQTREQLVAPRTHGARRYHALAMLVAGALGASARYRYPRERIQAAMGEKGDQAPMALPQAVSTS